MLGCNLPCTLLAGQMGSFTCHWGNTGMEYGNKRFSTDGWPCRRKFSCCSSPRNRTHYLWNTSLLVYHWATALRKAASYTVTAQAGPKAQKVLTCIRSVFCRLSKSSTKVQTARMEAGHVGLRTFDRKCWSMHFVKCLDICCLAFFWRVMFLVQPSNCSVFLWRVMFLVQPSNCSVFLWRVMFLVQHSNCSVFLWRVMFLGQPSNCSVFLWRVPLFF